MISFKIIFVNKKILDWTECLLNVVLLYLVYDGSSLVSIIAWCLCGTKPLSKPMMTQTSKVRRVKYLAVADVSLWWQVWRGFCQSLSGIRSVKLRSTTYLSFTCWEFLQPSEVTSKIAITYLASIHSSGSMQTYHRSSVLHYSDIKWTLKHLNSPAVNCLLSNLFKHTPKKTSKLCDTGLCEGNLPLTSWFLSKRPSNKENVSISQCCHESWKWDDMHYTYYNPIPWIIWYLFIIIWMT